MIVYCYWAKNYKKIDGITKYKIELTKALDSKCKMTFMLRFRILKYFNDIFSHRFFRVLLRIAKVSMYFLPYFSWGNQKKVLFDAAHMIPFFVSRKIAKVVTIHDLNWIHCPDTMTKLSFLNNRLLMPYAVKSADRIIAVSNHTKLDIVKKFPYAADKVKVVYHGFSKSEEKDDNIFIKNNIKKPYLLFVGTLEPRKNLARLIEAFASMPPDILAKYDLVICGAKGWGGIQIDDIAEKNNIKNNVIVTGYVSGGELNSLYAGAYCFAMPSLYEGFGLPIIEAQFCGVPVVVADNSSMPEVAGEGAIYVKALDQKSIAEGLRKMLTDSPLRDRLSIKAKANAARFSWEKTADETFEVFKEALEAKEAKKKGYKT